MIDLTVIALGNIKEDYYKEAIAEYSKRISAYAKITVKELKEEKISEEGVRSEIDKALKKEARSIIEAIPKNAYVISLCVEGKKCSSESFAKLIHTSSFDRPIAFVIGSSHGLDGEIKKLSDYKLSFSDMTFPHRLMRVILFEQIYRGLSILNNGKYHK